MILAKQKGRSENFFANLEAKYAQPEKKKRKADG